jgi:hypothetical protein
MADAPDIRRQKKKERLRHKEQMLNQLRSLAAQNIALMSVLGAPLPPVMVMGQMPVPLNLNPSFDAMRNVLQSYFQQQYKYFEQLIKDTEMEIDLMRKYDS